MPPKSSVTCTDADRKRIEEQILAYVKTAPESPSEGGAGKSGEGCAGKPGEDRAGEEVVLQFGDHWACGRRIFMWLRCNMAL